ncbi:MAG: rRNA maturation RNase YbeY [Candidatus Rokubacteria bacterium]|nr:rRNA maturation RNase YbeY [Candidatus Rokubacteria bacterium]
MAVAVANRQRKVPIALQRVRRAATRALAAVGRPAGEVEIDVVDDREIRRMNRRFRGVRRRTDVLAFPLEIPDAALLGQIVISAETAARQARRIGVPLAMEMDLLVTHGLLHLVGYDDRDPVEADLMHRRERDILSAGGTRVPDRLWRGLLRTVPAVPERSARGRHRHKPASRDSERRLRRRNPGSFVRAVGGVGPGSPRGRQPLRSRNLRSLPPTFK